MSLIGTTTSTPLLRHAAHRVALLFAALVLLGITLAGPLAPRASAEPPFFLPEPITDRTSSAVLGDTAAAQEAIDAFLAGEGDMVAGIRQPLEATARQHAGVRVLADNFTEIQQAICVARADVDRFHAVNDALSEWRADGSLQALIAGHLGQAN